MLQRDFMQNLFAPPKSPTQPIILFLRSSFISVPQLREIIGGISANQFAKVPRTCTASNNSPLPACQENYVTMRQTLIN